MAAKGFDVISNPLVSELFISIFSLLLLCALCALCG
jgi:hypothetical protein